MHHRDRLHRRRSFDEAGHAHELTFGCYRRYPFLKSSRVWEWLATAIDRARDRWKFQIWGYVFMPDHVHLIIKPRHAGGRIASILKDIKQPVGWQALQYLDAQKSAWRGWLTRVRNGRTERLFWQPGGGYDRNIVDPSTRASMLSYFHENPVRRGLVERASDWQWSSCGWFEGCPVNNLKPDSIPHEWC